ncbi:MAG: NUDIX domain-containing protein, partial [Succinatimonas sp.]|nr:NUDIX domain-containing protein [Succinatimonas sp.]
ATVALIIEHDGKYLVVEEYNEDQDNRLVFGNPAGHIEKQESIIEAALREGREETGCEVELLSLISIDDYVKDYETIYRFCFEARIKNLPENLKANDPDHEILDVKWYTKEEIYEKKDLWRTRLVGRNFDAYFAGQRLPLSLIDTVKS